ncbi:MAG: CIC family chloride channel protein [Planctomycetota bacterium]|jgi:CIC family chloride channel protein
MSPKQRSKDGFKRGAKQASLLLRALGLDELGSVGKWIGLSSLIGVIGGVVAFGFHKLLHFLGSHLLTPAVGVDTEGLGSVGGGLGGRAWLVLLILPIGGLVVGWLTQRFAPEAEGHGTEQMIRSFHTLGGKVRRRVIGLKALTSALTISTGGSAGQEGPVAQIGSGIGSAISDFLHLSEKERRIFLLAGSSAGIGALFSAPMGGALFAPEVLYRKPEFEGDAIIPCVIASIVGYTTFETISGGATKAIQIERGLLDRLTLNDPRELLLYLGLALLCTLVSFLYVRTFEGVHAGFKRIPVLPVWTRPGLGGLLTAGIALALAPFAGGFGVLFGGYGLMEGSIASSMSIGLMAMLVVGKILSTSFSIATGGSGGVFAPSLAIGGLLGAIVGQAAASWFPDLGVLPAAFALVGMAGFFAGVAKTPIAAILIVCEMTGGYGLLAPLMLVSVVHLMLSRRWTIYDTQVDSMVDSPAHAGDFVVDVLESMTVQDLLNDAPQAQLVSENTTLRKALEIVSTTHCSYFPVVNREEQLVGIFSLTDMRRLFQETGVADLVIVRDFMVDNVVTIRPEESLNDALRILNEHGLHELPIVSSEDERHVLGMLSRNRLGAAYHRRLHTLKKSGATP